MSRLIEVPEYDAFYGTALDHLLRPWGVDTLVICGTVATICACITRPRAPRCTGMSS